VGLFKSAERKELESALINLVVGFLVAGGKADERRTATVRALAEQVRAADGPGALTDARAATEKDAVVSTAMAHQPVLADQARELMRTVLGA
jgi:hypothetical protein